MYVPSSVSLQDIDLLLIRDQKPKLPLLLSFNISSSSVGNPVVSLTPLLLCFTSLCFALPVFPMSGTKMRGSFSVILITIKDPAGENFTAFDKKLTITCSMRKRSPIKIMMVMKRQDRKN